MFCLFFCRYTLHYFSSHPQVSLKLVRAHDGGIFMLLQPQSSFLEGALQPQSSFLEGALHPQSLFLGVLHPQSLRLPTRSQPQSLERLSAQSQPQPQFPLLKNNRNNKSKQQFIFRLISSTYLLLFYSLLPKRFLPSRFTTPFCGYRQRFSPLPLPPAWLAAFPTAFSYRGAKTVRYSPFGNISVATRRYSPCLHKFCKLQSGP